MSNAKQIEEAAERERALDSWSAATGIPVRDMTRTAYVEGWLAHARASRPREAGGGEKCPRCGITDPACHPCDANGTASPCFDDFHREQAIRKCEEDDCEARGLTKARVWRCAIHHPEHPANAHPASATAEGGGEAARIDEAHRVLGKPGRIDDDGCCVGCGRSVQPSPCCPDYPVWPGPCRMCYAPASARDEAERAFTKAAAKWVGMDRASNTPPYAMYPQREWDEALAAMNGTYAAWQAIEAERGGRVD